MKKKKTELNAENIFINLCFYKANKDRKKTQTSYDQSSSFTSKDFFISCRFINSQMKALRNPHSGLHILISHSAEI